ncbi:MAG TPA: ankyrin repeat domain-containing protein [Candidatus Babeliales bacterium]|nr:ankyrin repeat domain-containing protein [Candidatus Babeliales bacterium]
MQVKSGILLFLSILGVAYSIATFPAEAEVSLTRKDVLIAGGSLIVPAAAYKWSTDPLRKLCWAVELGDNPGAVDSFIQRKDKVGFFSPKNYSPLHHMIARGRTEMVKRYIELNRLTSKDIAKIRDNKQRSVLEYSIQCSQSDIVRYLMEIEAVDVNSANYKKESSSYVLGTIKGKHLALVHGPLDDAYKLQKQLTYYCTLMRPGSKKHQFFSNQVIKNQEIIKALRSRGAMTFQERGIAMFQEHERVIKESEQALLQLRPSAEQITSKL